MDRKEISVSLVRTVFSSIPYFGQILTEVAFDYRSKIKQNRLNQFVELLENYFSNHQGINLENFQTEKFSDLFESVLKRVIQTKSSHKHSMFRDILVNQLQNPQQSIDDSEIYLDLISTLGEIEIQMLYEYRIFVKPYYDAATEFNNLQRSLQTVSKNLKIEKELKGKEFESHDISLSEELQEIERKIGLKKIEVDKLLEIRKSSFFKITDDQFLYYKQRLFSKGLLIDNGVGSVGGKPFETMGITQFGKQFIDFILTP